MVLSGSLSGSHVQLQQAKTSKLQSLSLKKRYIFGAGPCGLIAASSLNEEEASTEVYEKRDVGDNGEGYNRTIILNKAIIVDRLSRTNPELSAYINSQTLVPAISCHHLEKSVYSYLRGHSPESVTFSAQESPALSNAQGEQFKKDIDRTAYIKGIDAAPDMIIVSEGAKSTTVKEYIPDAEYLKFSSPNDQKFFSVTFLNRPVTDNNKGGSLILPYPFLGQVNFFQAAGSSELYIGARVSAFNETVKQAMGVETQEDYKNQLIIAYKQFARHQDNTPIDDNDIKGASKQALPEFGSIAISMIKDPVLADNCVAIGASAVSPYFQNSLGIEGGIQHINALKEYLNSDRDQEATIRLRRSLQEVAIFSFSFGLVGLYKQHHDNSERANHENVVLQQAALNVQSAIRSWIDNKMSSGDFMVAVKSYMENTSRSIANS